MLLQAQQLCLLLLHLLLHLFHLQGLCRQQLLRLCGIHCLLGLAHLLDLLLHLLHLLRLLQRRELWHPSQSWSTLGSTLFKHLLTSRSFYIAVAVTCFWISSSNFRVAQVGLPRSME